MSPAPDMWWSWSGKKRGGPRNSRPRRKGLIRLTKRTSTGTPRWRIKWKNSWPRSPPLRKCWDVRPSISLVEALAEIRKVVARPAPRIMNYAEAAAKPRQRPPPQTLAPLQDLVVLSCSSVEDAKKIEERLKIRGADLKVAKPEMRLPTVIIRDVLRVNSDEDIVRSLRTQNRHLSEGLDWDKVRARVCYRRRARNDLECHPVLEVSPELYHRLIKAGFVYVGSKGARYGTSPRWCSVRAVSDTDTASVLQRSVREVRALRRGAHWRNMPGPKGWRAPKCVNCTKAGCEDTAHGAFSSECGVRAKWDDMARSKVAYCSSAPA
ncbi:hypothetical protein EVAR_61143_1 [Eumeta japonica]|uniref:Uncharacterized protein n=1 Tax=Eumeta variegata TaxID=151549 RepID=A0A4C2AF56_EUMVA|nr:hypothetical protein EVAR_61143_1 [Eumeta japonica]